MHSFPLWSIVDNLFLITLLNNAMVKRNFLSMSQEPDRGDCVVCELEEEELMRTINNTMWVKISVNTMIASYTGLYLKLYDDFIAPFMISNVFPP